MNDAEREADWVGDCLTMLDAVLPLTSRDLARFRILERSVDLFFDVLGTCWVVTPDGQFDEVSEAITSKKFRTIRETSVVPELYAFPRLSGWFKQQTTKLAIAEMVQSDFYVTLDADVICTRPIRYSDLIREGRAVNHRYRGSTHGGWYWWVERTLRLKRSGWVHAVTPTILNRRAVGQLAEFLLRLQDSLAETKRGAAIRRHFSRDIWTSWRGFLLSNTPWTEYALYFTFLEAHGLYEEYYAPAEYSLYGQGVWHREQFEHWDPSTIFGDDRFYFTVVQSNTGISPEAVWRKVEPYLVRDAGKSSSTG